MPAFIINIISSTLQDRLFAIAQSSVYKSQLNEKHHFKLDIWFY